MIKLVDRHPNMEIVVASSRALKGKRLGDLAEVTHSAFGDLLFTEVQPAEIAQQEVMHEMRVCVCVCAGAES